VFLVFVESTRLSSQQLLASAGNELKKKSFLSASSAGSRGLVVVDQHLLDLSDGASRVQALRAGLGAVHDGVAAVDGEPILHHLKALVSELIAGVDHPAVGLHKHGGAQVLVAVPPVGRARRGAAGAQDALVQAVQLCPVLHRLEVLL